MEVPEIQEGVVEIRGIVREAGTRSKIAVATLDPNVDPVGACVGTKGSRIKSISSELRGERMDIIIWHSDPLQFIRNALSPAKILKVEPVLETDRAVRVYVRPDQCLWLSARPDKMFDSRRDSRGGKSTSRFSSRRGCLLFRISLKI